VQQSAADTVAGTSAHIAGCMCHSACCCLSVTTLLLTAN
jgi:hypothetical protein